MKSLKINTEGGLNNIFVPLFTDLHHRIDAEKEKTRKAKKQAVFYYDAYKDLYNHSICNEKDQVSSLKASDFQFFCPLLPQMAILCQ